MLSEPLIGLTNRFQVEKSANAAPTIQVLDMRVQLLERESKDHLSVLVGTLPLLGKVSSICAHHCRGASLNPSDSDLPSLQCVNYSRPLVKIEA